ncbi:unnamed protein product [Microthlaspi erraticum]|uniref:Uncharacterized protein n=1 Tax=Microthlaspi erraticum TaxID=1685480 RepID=A0A6D2HY60_9BRAS|nr:unnamed protein product [Microthlaspi erraticum]
MRSSLDSACSGILIISGMPVKRGRSGTSSSSRSESHRNRPMGFRHGIPPQSHNHHRGHTLPSLSSFLSAASRRSASSLFHLGSLDHSFGLRRGFRFSSLPPARLGRISTDGLAKESVGVAG